jgi:superoxide dismutase, Cu-Zn family
MTRSARCLAALAILLLPAVAAADETTVVIHEVDTEGVGAAIGEITFVDTEYGLLIVPNFSSAAPGLHGTHVHENPDCDAAESNGAMVPAGAAGGHYDPENTGQHLGPYGEGHLGDLPNIFVEADGTASVPVLAPRVTVADLKGRAIVLHAGADRYDNEDMGGARMYCGVVE